MHNQRRFNYAMSEYILYRDVKVTANYIKDANNPFWDDKIKRGQYGITIENVITKNSTTINYWRSIDLKHPFTQEEIKEALCGIMQDASYGDNTWEGYCADLEIDEDSLKAKETFEYIQKENKELLSIEPEFDFGADVEFLDNPTTIYENRVYSKQHQLWNRPSEAIVLFEDEEYFSYWEENRAHPGGSSTDSLGDGWMDDANRMPFHNNDCAWTWSYTKQSNQESYSITPVQVQLTKSEPNQDDDYYLTI